MRHAYLRNLSNPPLVCVRPHVAWINELGILNDVEEVVKLRHDVIEDLGGGRLMRLAAKDGSNV